MRRHLAVFKLDQSDSYPRQKILDAKQDRRTLKQAIREDTTPATPVYARIKRGESLVEAMRHVLLAHLDVFVTQREKLYRSLHWHIRNTGN